MEPMFAEKKSPSQQAFEIAKHQFQTEGIPTHQQLKIYHHPHISSMDNCIQGILVFWL
jgi:hypothetical protein